jgi:twitching motility protein PilT
MNGKEDLNYILTKAQQTGNVTDVHLVAGYPPIYRINKKLVTEEEFRVLSLEDPLALIWDYLYESFAPNMDNEDQKRKVFEAKLVDMLNKAGFIDFSFGYPSFSRYRATVYKQRNSFAVAIRLIPFDIPDLPSLRVSPVMNEIIDNDLSKGLVLVTGPTGSGKSTTIASAIEAINKKQRKHIITFEDPIEFLFMPKKSLIVQREMGTDVGNISQAIRGSLREDPDILFVGEIMDTETMRSTLLAAETGHLVFSTIHTSSAIETISRIINMFPGNEQEQVRAQLSLSLTAVFTQQLLPREDKNGLVLAQEVLILNHAMRSSIREKKEFQINNTFGTTPGCVSMNSAIRVLLSEGVVNKSVAESYLSEKGM